MSIFKSVYTAHEEAKYCSVQVPEFCGRGLTFQIKAMLATRNSALPGCLPVVDLSLFAACFQDKPDSF